MKNLIQIYALLIALVAVSNFATAQSHATLTPFEIYHDISVKYSASNVNNRKKLPLDNSAELPKFISQEKSGRSSKKAQKAAERKGSLSLKD